jgi:hypothetical protein
LGIRGNGSQEINLTQNYGLIPSFRCRFIDLEELAEIGMTPASFKKLVESDGEVIPNLFSGLG